MDFHLGLFPVGYFPANTTQEAQLPLRNRALVMHFFVAELFSITVMNYSYVYHLRNRTYVR